MEANYENKIVTGERKKRDLIFKKTHTLASSRPRSLTGVPDLGDMRCDAESSSCPSILPGHQEPFLRLTQTIVPTPHSPAPIPPSDPSDAPILQSFISKQKKQIYRNKYFEP